jgi:hypothetical protein
MPNLPYSLIYITLENIVCRHDLFIYQIERIYMQYLAIQYDYRNGSGLFCGYVVHKSIDETDIIF